MTGPSRLLALLVLPLLALCSFNLLADTVDGAPKALHLLDYIGADYPPTVEAGKVIDESEYREQVEFLGVLQGLIADLNEEGPRHSFVGRFIQPVDTRVLLRGSPETTDTKPPSPATQSGTFMHSYCLSIPAPYSFFPGCPVSWTAACGLHWTRPRRLPNGSSITAL